MKQVSILLIEDDASVANAIKRYMNEESLMVEHVDNGADGLSSLRNELPQILLLDLNLPDMNGMDILKTIHKESIPTEVIIITGHGNEGIVVEAMKHGAFDFLAKPFDGERLIVSVNNAIEHHRLTGIVEEFEDLNRSRFHNFIGRSNPMQAVYNIIENAAPSKATIFIQGESGTGKELCAEAIHKISDRNNSPFIPLNCAAIPKGLVESEVFGHIKGSFTGAMKDREGAVSRADHGTLFLDEICEMDIDLQAKLLRFLQSGQFQRVGSNSTETVNARIVCATNRDPLVEIKEGRFREDLYYRLNVIPINLPPLRDRDDDVFLIARYFLDKFNKEENKEFNKFSDVVEKIFLEHSWPGNVRQLENVIRNIIVLNKGTEVSVGMLPDDITGETSLDKITKAPKDAIEKQNVEENKNGYTQIDIKPLWIVEKEAITQAINACDGNIPKAATLLDVSPSTIYRKIQLWNADKDK
jgi:DNA-binding NtrC family response regulator